MPERDFVYLRTRFLLVRFTFYTSLSSKSIGGRNAFTVSVNHERGQANLTFLVILMYVLKKGFFQNAEKWVFSAFSKLPTGTVSRWRGF